METSELEGHPEFHRLLNEMRQTHIDKSAGYAGSDNPDPFANFRRCEAPGFATQTKLCAYKTLCATRMTNVLEKPFLTHSSTLPNTR